MITVTYILQQFYGAMIGVGTYYAKYILADENMFGTFAWFINIPLIICLDLHSYHRTKMERHV